MPSRYKDFPPGWDHIKVPVSSRRAALAGLSLYAACRPKALWIHRLAWGCVEIFGPRALPGRSGSWIPLTDLDWRALSEVWRRELGRFDEVAGFARVDAQRGGIALLLLRAGSPVAFVKLHRGAGGGIASERRALEALSKCRPRSFRAPELLQSDSLQGWHYLATAPLPLGLHRPAHDPPLEAILDEIDGALAQLPRPEGAPAHWRPMHGDFAAWNLRQCSGRALCLMDWENAGWGPPRADAVFYRAAEAALRSTLPMCAGTDTDEAIRFWCRHIAADAGNARDRRLACALRSSLRHMAHSVQVGKNPTLDGQEHAGQAGRCGG